MVRKRHTRQLSEAEKIEILARLRAARRSLLLISKCQAFGSDLYREADLLMAKIDDMAGLLTDDRELFWLKPH